MKKGQSPKKHLLYPRGIDRWKNESANGERDDTDDRNRASHRRIHYRYHRYMGRFRIGRCSSDPISFAVESAKLSGLAEPGKDWPPHAPNFRARRAQSVIRYRLNSPSIFFLSLFLPLCFLFFHPFLPHLFRVASIFSYFSFLLPLSLSLSCHSFFFHSLSFFPAFFRFFFTGSTAWLNDPQPTVSRAASNVERGTNLVPSRCDSCFLASKSNRSNLDISAYEGELIDTGTGKRESTKRSRRWAGDFSDRGCLMRLIAGAGLPIDTAQRRIFLDVFA